jgi:hypothetical protein
LLATRAFRHRVGGFAYPFKFGGSAGAVYRLTGTSAPFADMAGVPVVVRSLVAARMRLAEVGPGAPAAHFHVHEQSVAEIA